MEEEFKDNILTVLKLGYSYTTNINKLSEFLKYNNSLTSLTIAYRFYVSNINKNLKYNKSLKSLYLNCKKK